MMKQSVTFQTESGQTMAEYAVVLGVITLIIVATISLLAGQIGAAFVRTFNLLTSVG